MHKYLFITYGESGWRGVQVRALRMASYLPKNEVLFWNLYDSSFIRDHGFKVETQDSSLVDPNWIVFPKGIEVIIFSDLPSNEFFNFSVFVAAKKYNLKIVICEQIYRKGQTNETVYKRFITDSDLFLMNGLSYFESEESTNKVKIVPPQIEMNMRPEMRDEMRNKYKIPKNALVLLGVGYHQNITDKIINITHEIACEQNNFVTVITGVPQVSNIKREKNLILLPYDIGDDYFKLLYTADLVMTKFGFLQILEALALKKPVLVLGEGGWILRTPDKVDPILQSTLRFYLSVDNEAHNFINRFVTDIKYRQNLKSKIEKLHDGKLYGAKKAIEIIKKLKKKQIKPYKSLKKLAILVNNEISDYQDWLNREIAYPLCVILGMPTQSLSKKAIPEEILEKKIREINNSWTKDILPHSFKNIVLFSQRRLDGYVDMMPWYEEWIKGIVSLFESADEIYITPQGESIFRSLLKSNIRKLKKYE